MRNFPNYLLGTKTPLDKKLIFHEKRQIFHPSFVVYLCVKILILEVIQSRTNKKIMCTKRVSFPLAASYINEFSMASLIFHDSFHLSNSFVFQSKLSKQQ